MKKFVVISLVLVFFAFFGFVCFYFLIINDGTYHALFPVAVNSTNDEGVRCVTAGRPADNFDAVIFSLADTCGGTPIAKSKRYEDYGSLPLNDGKTYIPLYDLKNDKRILYYFRPKRGLIESAE